MTTALLKALIGQGATDFKVVGPGIVKLYRRVQYVCTVTLISNSFGESYYVHPK